MVLALDLTDSADNFTTLTRRSHLADLTTDPPSVRRLCNGYSLLTQYFEDRW